MRARQSGHHFDILPSAFDILFLGFDYRRNEGRTAEMWSFKPKSGRDNSQL
jgi:hypothetical protein